MKSMIMLIVAIGFCCASLAHAAATKSHKGRRDPPRHVAVTKHDRNYRGRYHFPMHHGDDY